MTRLSAVGLLIILLIGWGIPRLAAADAELRPGGESPGAAAREPELKQDSPIDVLIEVLKSKNADRVRRAADFIGNRVPEAKGRGAVLSLMRALDNSETRFVALLALEKFGPDAAPAAPGIYRTLLLLPTNSNSGSRGLAAKVLASIGEAAVPTLQKGTQSKYLPERFACHVALAKREGPGSPHQQVLVTAMLSENHSTAQTAIEFLRMLGPAVKSAVPQIITALKNPNGPKSDLILLLAGLRKEAVPAIPQLIVLLDDRDDYYRGRAASALSEIGGPESKKFSIKQPSGFIISGRTWPAM